MGEKKKKKVEFIGFPVPTKSQRQSLEKSFNLGKGKHDFIITNVMEMNHAHFVTILPIFCQIGMGKDGVPFI